MLLTHAIKALISSLPFEDNQILIGGSYAMKLYGVPSIDTYGDVDLIVYNATADQLRVLDILNETFGTTHLDVYRQRSHKFKIGDFTIDVLVETNTKPVVELEHLGIGLVPMNTIIEAKKRYARPKDYQSIQAIVADLVAPLPIEEEPEKEESR